MAADKLRDLSQPIDVALLDATVAAFYGTGSKEEVRDCSSSFLFLALLSVCFSRKFKEKLKLNRNKSLLQRSYVNYFLSIVSHSF